MAELENVQAACLRNLIYHGTVLPARTPIDLPSDTFERLAAKGIVCLRSELPDLPEAPPPPELSEDVQRFEAVVAAIAELPADAYTQGGLPECDALSDALGFDVSASVRNQAFEEYGRRGAG